MFENVEKGLISWDNEIKVQLESYRVQDAAERTANKNEMICRQWNAGPRQCAEDDSCKEHVMGNTLMKHICSHCMKAYNASLAHPEWKCRNKRNGVTSLNQNRRGQPNFNNNVDRNNMQNRNYTQQIQQIPQQVNQQQNQFMPYNPQQPADFYHQYQNHFNQMQQFPNFQFNQNQQQGFRKPQPNFQHYQGGNQQQQQQHQQQANQGKN